MSETVRQTDEKKLLSALGFGARSGGLIFGVPMICEALRAPKKKGKYPLIVFEACDTSENTHKRISDRCGYYGVKLVRLKTDGVTLGEALGKRTMLAAVALTNENLSVLAEKYI